MKIEKGMSGIYPHKEREDLREWARTNLGMKEIIIDRDLPFHPSYNQYIYVESFKHSQINDYFHKNLDEINASGGGKQQILFFPEYIEGELSSIIRYNRPGYDNGIIDELKVNINQIQIIYDKIISHIKDVSDGGPVINTPCLISLDDSRGIKDYRFSMYPLVYENDAQFLQLIQAIFEVPSFDSGIRCSSVDEILYFESSISEGEPKVDINWADKQSITDLAYEIRQRIEKLQLMGVSDFVIRNLIKLPEAKLSPLLITPDYRIILPAYNNMEIEMPTLSKVVYFFFLRHPAGLRFKELIDYRVELMGIYCTISNRENLEKMQQSIDELVDSTRNSINEKCSRIRAAFISQFADDLAHHYYITGGYATPKRITLDRNMLIDKSGITC